jgi:hypothetical protein
LQVTRNEWSGLGDGHGYLRTRQLGVGVTTRTGRREREVVLP